MIVDALVAFLGGRIVGSS
ncbi:MAG: hypothetical protein ACKOLA_07130 [Spartobacteria bacterium]